MQLIVDSKDTPEHLRLAASFILHLAGDIADEPTAEAPTPPAPVPPPPPSNVTQLFPTPPPPPPPADTAATAGTSDTSSAPTAAAARTAASVETPPPFTFPTSGATASTTSTASAAAAPPANATQTTSPFSGQVDSAGLPWDARIHQKKGGVKKDGTWKLLKGIDMTVVSAVVAELTKGKLPASVTAPPAQTDAFPAAVGAVPPPPASSTVPLPPTGTGSNSVPVPPPPATPAVPEQVSGSAAPVPAAGAPAVGSVPAASGFRDLIKKISAATNAGKIDAAKIQSIVQARGCPSLQQLRDMPTIIPEVEADVDALLLG